MLMGRKNQYSTVFPSINSSVFSAGMYAVLTLKIKSGSRYRSNYGTPVLSTGINNRKCDMIGTNKKNNAPQARPHPAAPAERPAAQRPKGATYGNHGSATP